MFVDASAIVAILNREPEADAFADSIEDSEAAVTSAIAIFEATLALCRIRHATVDDATADVEEFLNVARIRCVAIGPAEAKSALAAFARYGKGRGHPAQLNLGDCFAYAVARNQGIPLLFKGNDFANTDIESAA
ncbi:MAG: type II toxin-antitoxin system VapC family toxin [Alphaproteobacteria bacterium]|nr:type II toxin-antitoxin system VapC family toxin [Alphaproteobacteria bacterium]